MNYAIICYTILPLVEQDFRRPEFSSQQEQLELSALVNRFCVLEPEEFDPNIHLDDARKIVRALNPRIDLLSKTTVTGRARMPQFDRDSVVVGATEIGEVKTTIENKDKKPKDINIKLGKPKEFRIGAYVVTKFASKDIAFLQFENFWGYGGANEALENYPPFWTIGYDLKNLELQSIQKHYSLVEKKVIDFFIMKLETRRVKDLPKTVWESQDR